jgi:hypothetical protein
MLRRRRFIPFMLSAVTVSLWIGPTFSEGNQLTQAEPSQTPPVQLKPQVIQLNQQPSSLPSPKEHSDAQIRTIPQVQPATEVGHRENRQRRRRIV